MTREPADLELFAQCFSNNSTPRLREMVAWQYAANPTGRMFVDFALARDEGSLAAIYATQPVRFRIDGRIVLAVQSVDTMTDAGYRGLGLFVKLAKSVYARAAEAGVKFVYGFPNGNSAHGIFDRLGWTSLDPLPFLIRPLRSAYALERLGLAKFGRFLPNLPLQFGGTRSPRGGTLETITQFDERATRLWHDFARRIGVAVERDARYLDWRLIEKPGEHYESVALVDGGEWAAMTSHVVKDKHGGRVGYMMEALCAQGRQPALRGLIRRALGRMMRDGADVALALCLPHSPNYTSFLRQGFIPFPAKFRPIELHFGARSFDPTIDQRVVDRRSWYLSYLDSDTV